MNDEQDRAAARAERRARMERLLENYTNLDIDEKSELIRWLRREATALDIALLSSIDPIREGYRAFRAEHIDRFSWRDIIRISILLSLIGAFVAAIFR